MAKILMVFIVAFGLQMNAVAQENSPYSRYGLGDLTPNHNVFTRGMGGISAGVADFISFNNPKLPKTSYLPNSNGINFANPASLSTVRSTIFDVGTEIDYRILKSSVPAKKFTSANTYVSYLQLAFPLTTKKMDKKGMSWGLSLGLKPVSKINYKIEKNERLTNIDSLNTLYEGSGGVNQVNVGTGFKYRNFSIGVNAGYMFGSKDYSTKLTFIPDSAFNFYYKSNSENSTTFGGFFYNVGLQYDFILAKDDKNNITKNLRLGVYGNMQQNLNASNDLIRETFFYDANGNQYQLDSVYIVKDVKGKIKYPAMITAGAVYQTKNWLLGADFEFGNWAAYRYYGQTDAALQNNWTVRVGTQYYPATINTAAKKYFNFVKYRAGFFYGPDYIKATANRPEYGFTVGTGMPLTTLRRISYSGEYVVLNTGLEFASRGNKQTNLRENMVRFSIGLSMNARWFQKPKYN